MLIRQVTWSEVDDGGWELASDGEWVYTTWTIWIDGEDAFSWEHRLALNASLLVDVFLQFGAVREYLCGTVKYTVRGFALEWANLLIDRKRFKERELKCSTLVAK